MKYVAFLDILGFKNTLKTLGQERSIEYIENYSRIVYQVFSRYNRNEERQNTEKKINGFVVSDSVVLYTNDAMKESLSDLLNIIVDLCREEFGRNSIQQIMKQTGLKRASVHAYLPYSKGSYNLSESSLNAERKKNYRNRKSVCERLCQNINLPDVEEYLWSAIVAFADYPFKTETGLPMKYTVKGGEIFFNRKEKSVTRATVMRAFMKARQIQKAEGYVSGSKRLGMFGASYLYPIFLRIGVCLKNR